MELVEDAGDFKKVRHDVPMLTLAVKRIIPARLYNAIYAAEGRWAEPDIDDLCDKMRWVVANRETAWAMEFRWRL
jgi:hypothetical protein